MISQMFLTKCTNSTVFVICDLWFVICVFVEFWEPSNRVFPKNEWMQIFTNEIYTSTNNVCICVWTEQKGWTRGPFHAMDLQITFTWIHKLNPLLQKSYREFYLSLYQNIFLFDVAIMSFLPSSPLPACLHIFIKLHILSHYFSFQIFDGYLLLIK